MNFFRLLLLVLTASPYIIFAQSSVLDKRVDSVLRLMTLEEKVGQLHQLSSDFVATGPITKDGDKQDRVRQGKVGSYLNVTGAARTRSLQEIAMQSRLRIPLLFAQDVIHGYRTIFPIPLAEAASWDIAAMEQTARVAAIEAAASGIHWTFAPMVDIARDPRWGRVMEGAGEDSYLGSRIAAARVKGFQGKGIGSIDAVMACAKHFAAYGAAEGGRDYNSVDMSLRKLYEVYLPPFKAAKEAGVSSFMNSFNDLNGVPATGSSFLQRKLLKGDWTFKGIVVSDWGSIGEMVNHGYATDLKDAALIAMRAGSDIDMESRAYSAHLSQLIKEKKVDTTLLNDAVKRVLYKKFELGLFDDPYRFSDEKREQAVWNNTTHLQVAREMARKSIVLLKNEVVPAVNKPLLPLNKGDNKKIALVGPLVKAIGDNNGFWSYSWPDDSSRVVSLWQGVTNKLVGDYNPSGKLPITFPRNEGQIPIYYNYLSTGRPFKSDTDNTYVTAYTDLPNSPRYVFGYGLSYTSFQYGAVQLNTNTLSKDQKLQAKITVTNTGKYAGEEVVQLYMQDVVASIVRPVRELKAFEKVLLKPGEFREITFTLDARDLSFYNDNLELVAEPGTFHLYIGGNSQATQKASFTLL